jgi:mannose-6-phosphate isomerase-like protein (cupin superfamily)
MSSSDRSSTAVTEKTRKSDGAGYTIKNLKEIEDMALKFDMSPDLEARFAPEPLESEESGISYLRLAPNFRMPFGHTHKEQEEVYVLVSGSGRIKLDDDVVELRQWDAVRIASDTMRCLEGGPEGAELILFGAPNAGSGDAVQSPGWWDD